MASRVAAPVSHRNTRQERLSGSVRSGNDPSACKGGGEGPGTPSHVYISCVEPRPWSIAR